MADDALEIESGGDIEAPQGVVLGEALTVWRERTRRELGIETARPALVTGAGHQAFLWHPGILAKFVQARRVTGTHGVVVHLVVDHDVLDPSLVRVPVRRGADDAQLGAVTHRLGPPAGAVAAMTLPAFEPRAYDGPEPALPSIAAGLAQAHAALADARAAAPNAPMQVAAALSSLMKPWVGDTQLVADSALLSTSLGRAIVENMRSDPHRCAASFNRALAIDPHAARPLRAGTDPELPLWELDRDGRRLRVTASRLTAGALWLPRTFLLSAIMRLGVCDRFVHGTGARRYERVTEAWMRDWLGVELPPIDVASATLRLPLLSHRSEHEVVLTPDARRMAWWNPESLESAPLRSRADEARAAALMQRGAAPGARKKVMLDAIAALPRRSPERRARYRQMLQELDVLRHARAGAFASLDARLAAESARADALRLAHDRTWAFVFFDDAQLDAVFGRARL